jgi:hypothetical protein
LLRYNRIRHYCNAVLNKVIRGSIVRQRLHRPVGRFFAAATKVFVPGCTSSFLPIL